MNYYLIQLSNTNSIYDKLLESPHQFEEEDDKLCMYVNVTEGFKSCWNIINNLGVNRDDVYDIELLNS